MPLELVNTGPDKANICIVLISEVPGGGAGVRDRGLISSPAPT